MKTMSGIFKPSCLLKNNNSTGSSRDLSVHISPQPSTTRARIGQFGPGANLWIIPFLLKKSTPLWKRIPQRSFSATSCWKIANWIRETWVIIPCLDRWQLAGQVTGGRGSIAQQNVGTEWAAILKCSIVHKSWPWLELQCIYQLTSNGLDQGVGHIMFYEKYFILKPISSKIEKTPPFLTFLLWVIN